MTEHAFETLTLPLFIRPEQGEINTEQAICQLRFTLDESLLAEVLQAMRDFDQGASFVSLTLHQGQLFDIHPDYQSLINPSEAEPELHLAPWGEFSPALSLQSHDGEWVMLVGPSVDFTSLFDGEDQ